MNQDALDFIRSHEGRLMLEPLEELQTRLLEVLLEATTGENIVKVARARGRYEGVTLTLNKFEQLRGDNDGEE